MNRMTVFIAWLLALIILEVQPGLAGNSPRIDPSLRRSIQQRGTASVLVTMRDRTSAVLEGLSRRQFLTRGDRITAIAEELQKTVAASQAKVLHLLEEELSRKERDDIGFSYKSFWISNQILIIGASPKLLEKLEVLSEIEHVAEERVITIPSPHERPFATILTGPNPAAAIGQKQTRLNKAATTTTTTTTTPSPGKKPWGIERINASKVWEAGVNGSGIVVGVMSTGVRGSHEALHKNYRADHGWMDFNAGILEPYDDQGQGTHLAGIIVGSKENIGVAPGSQWIACKPCNGGHCTEGGFIECGQWFLCPTNASGAVQNCTKAPHVISNGWSGGSTDDRFYEKVLAVWTAARIIPIFPVGDEGPSCSSASFPGNYANVIGVGAMDMNNYLTESSGVGPSKFGTGFKPDVLGPGARIWSSTAESDNHYSATSLLGGTAMAAAHVSGTVALMLSSRPPKDLPCFESIRDALLGTSMAIENEGRECGGLADHHQPNYHHGYGRINAQAAVQTYKNMTLKCW